MNINYTELITIAIPVYERTAFFEEAFLSSINQSIKCPIIIVDNNSSHNFFRDYVQEYNTKYNLKIKYIKNSTNLGVYGNCNECIKLTSTPFVTILHDDDALHPLFIEFSLNEIQKGREYFACNAISQRVSLNYLNEINYKEARCYRFRPSLFLLEGLSPFPGIVFRVNLALKIGGFDEKGKVIADFDFWLRMSYISKCYKTTTPLAYYRISDSQGTTDVYAKVVSEVYSIRKTLPYYKLLKYISIYRTFIFYKYYRAQYSDNNENMNDIKDVSNELYNIFKKYESLEKWSFFRIVFRYTYRIVVWILIKI